MCKIWEMLFESMPSVGLSTYAMIVNVKGNMQNTSVLVSMLFSFINITNTIVNLLENDHKNRLSRAQANYNINDFSSGQMTSNTADLDQTGDMHEQVVEMTACTSNVRIQEDGNESNCGIFDKTLNDIRFFKEEKYVSTRERMNNNQRKQACKQCVSSMFRFNIEKFKSFVIWIFLSSDLFVKMLSILFIIAFVNNYNKNTKIINEAICLVLVSLVLMVEYFSFKFLVIKEKFTKIFALKYFVVCTFKISFYFLSLIGLTYLPKMIDKQSFIKYQSFKTCLSIFYVLIVLFSQLVLQSDVIAVKFFVLFVSMLFLHVVSFVYLNRVMFNFLF